MNEVPTRPIRRKRSRDRVTVLFTPDLGKQVRELAKRERRPLSSQVQVLIQRALMSTEAATTAA